MIRKTDKYIKRKARIYERGYTDSSTVFEIARRETWWLFWVIPIYSMDTVIDKPR